MAIVHPAFCEVARRFDGTIAQGRVHAGQPGDRRSGSRIKIVDTKHFKNRVYSSRTVDVFSASDIAARQ
jgi:hypothetical protein